VKNNKKKAAKVSIVAMLRQDKGFIRKYAGLFATATTLVGAIGGMAYLGAQIQETHVRNAAILTSLGTEKALSQQISKNILLLQREWRDGKRVNRGELSELTSGRSRFQAILDSLAGLKPLSGVPSPGNQYRGELDKLAKAFAPMGAQIDILGGAGAAMAGSAGQNDRDLWLASRKAFSLVSTAGREDDVPNAFIDNPDLFKAAPTAESTAQASMSEEVTKTANTFNNYAGELLSAVDALDAKVGKDIGDQDERASDEQRRIGYLGAALFLLTLVYFIRKNILADYLIRKNDRERVAILDNLGEALFLMDTDWNVQGQVSEFTKRLFGGDFGPGSNALEAIRRTLDDEKANQAQRFAQLFKTRTPSAIKGMNPLSLVNLQGVDGEMHVGFKFSKIVDEAGRMVSILVSAADSTDQVILKSALAQEVSRNSAQFTLLSELVASPNREAVLALVVEVIAWIEKCNASLKAPAPMELARFHNVREIAGEAHTFKAQAEGAGLGPIVNALHDLETELLGASKNGAVNPEALLQTPLRFKRMLETLSVYRLILAPATASAGAAIAVFAEIKNIVESQALRSGKTVVFRALGDAPEDALNAEGVSAIRACLTHIAKNSVIHGVETEETRAAAGKRREGKVSVACRVENGSDLCTVFDDGGGVDAEAIRRKLMADPKTSATAPRMSRRELVEMTFADGMSTREEVDTDSGRGIGLSAARSRIKALGGAISVKSSEGKGSEFTIVLPTNNTNEKGEAR
jgi:signal transduction histidine kinase